MSKKNKLVTYKCIDCGKEKTGRPSTFHKPRDEYRCFDCSMKHRDADPNYISAIKSAGLKRRKQRITRICVDCGKEKTGLPSEFPSTSDDEEYRCKKCTNRKRKNSKVTYKCIDCGTERTGYPSSFHKPREKYRCNKCAVKHYFKEHPEKKITFICIDCGKEKTATPTNFRKPPEEYRCKDCARKHMLKNPEYKKHMKEAGERRSKDPKFKQTMKRAAVERNKNPKYWENLEMGMQKRMADPIYMNQHVERLKERTYDPIFRENLLISLTGQGFWMGHPILSKGYSKQQYCEKFEEVDPRVRAFQGTTCLLCEKTEEENGNKMNNHHVFYEKKTCCWIDDNGEYWTNLNIKGHKKDYYIGENPNYFALLCNCCHSGSNGSYENRKKHADLLRDVIDTKFNGKSYYTEEEMIEHGYVKISRTKWEKID